MSIQVYGNDLERALKVLKRQLQKEGIFRDIKRKKYYEKPSEKKKRKRIEARKKRMKAIRFSRG